MTTPVQDVPNPDANGLQVRHIVSLVFAVGITVIIFLLREHLQTVATWGYVGAFLTMLLGNATIVLPVPGLIVVFALGGTLNPLLVGLAAGPGAALGEMTAYAAGYGGSATIDNTKLYQRIKHWMDRFGPIVISALAAIPNPLFDMAGIVAGASKMAWWRFLLFAWLGKTIQAISIAYAGFYSVGWVLRFLE